LSYIGKTPTPAPLTSSDITDGIISNSKLAQDIISAETELATAPADTDEFLISDAGVLKRLDASLVGGGGITMAQQWRLTANFTGSQEPITSNLEIVDTYGYGSLGSNMTESSGIFSFPATGYYLIITNHGISNTNFERGASMNPYTTTDGTNYNQCTQSANAVTPSSSANTIQYSSSFFIFDVTNTSTHKIQFQVNVITTGSTVTRGDTNYTETGFTFIRLGDT